MRALLVRVFVLLSCASGSVHAPAATAQYVDPGPNLAIQNVAPIPRALADTLAAYSALHGQRLLGWHPDKFELLITQRADRTSQLFRFAAPDTVPEPITTFNEAVSLAAYPPRASDYLIYAQDSGGNERYRLFRFDLATKQSTALTDANRRASSIVFARPTDDPGQGERLFYTSLPTGQRAESSTLTTEVRAIDPARPASNTLIARLPGVGWSVQDVAHDRKSLVIGEYVGATESYLWLLDIDSGTKKLLTPRRDASPASFGRALFLPGARRVLALSTYESEFSRLIEIDTESRALSVLVTRPWSIDSYALSNDARWLAYRTNEDGTSVLRIIDRRDGGTVTVTGLPTGVIGAFAWRSDDRSLAINVSAARDPLAIVVFDVQSGALTRWSVPTAAKIDPRTFAEPELVRWKSFDGRTISGYLYTPPERFTGKRPVKIVIHGGPESQSRPGFIGRYNYLLNDLGTALVFPNVRGSSGYGKTFLSLDDGRKREDAVRDIGALLDWIAAHPRLDGDRVLVSGGSYGGYMSLATATLYPERIACAIADVGIANFVSFLENTESYRRDLRRIEYGDERDPEMRAFLHSISPSTRAERIKRPLLIVHGANDPRVPVSEAEAIIAAVRKNGTPVSSIIARNEGHGFARRENADFRFLAGAMFARSCLRPEPAGK